MTTQSNPQSENECLYVVSTPIGNLQDISPRAIEVLKKADIIACEDTRQTAKLCSLLDIKAKKLISYYDHNEEQRAKELVLKIKDHGMTIALVSDAGTPCISDPGYRLVQHARNENIKVCPIPGACAITALVAVSGLPSNRFLFIGFLPPKKHALLKEIGKWQNIDASIVCYESPNRLEKSLLTLQELYPNARLAIGRELTKMYEETLMCSLKHALEWCQNNKTLKGELVLMIDVHHEPGTKNDEDEIEQITKEAQDLLSKNSYSHKDLMKYFSSSTLTKKSLYNLLLKAIKDHKPT